MSEPNNSLPLLLALPERVSRWSNLRAFGVSPIVRITIIMPVLGYLILLSEQFQGALGNLVLPGGSKDLIGWRIYAVYFGSLLLGIGSLTFSAFCPRTIKKHASPVAFVNEEEVFFSSPEHKSLISGWFDIACARAYNWQFRLPALWNAQFHRGFDQSPESGDRERDLLRVAMNFLWHLRDTCKPLARMVTFILFWAGSLLIAAPSAFTACQVVHSVWKQAFGPG